uniref:Uncharacterized protein n=1 Tax=Hyaloperonospora arabidopsidis (strain Emoy2) TaxID=559515 RepID=M4BMM6_HYAAE
MVSLDLLGKIESRLRQAKGSRDMDAGAWSEISFIRTAKPSLICPSLLLWSEFDTFDIWLSYHARTNGCTKSENRRVCGHERAKLLVTVRKVECRYGIIELGPSYSS